MIDLRAEIGRLNERVKTLILENEALRKEISRLSAVNDAHTTRFRELQGVPADCVLIPLSDRDMQLLAGG